MVQRKKKGADTHPAMKGLEMFMNKTPERDRATAMRELKKQTGMGTLDMMEYLGSKASGKKVPTPDEIQQAERMQKLENGSTQ
jgi:hypothetical protein